MNEIQTKHEIIVMEALGTGMIGNIASSVNAKLKGIAGAFGDWARGKIRPEVKIPLVAYNAVVKDLAGSRYSDVSASKITTPRGLKGPLLPYTESLFDVLVKVENVEEEMLKPFNIWLSLRLASPDTLASSATVTDLKNFKEQDIEGSRIALSKFVDPLGRVDKLPLQSVYENLSQIKPTWDNANALATRYLETNPAKIVKLVQEIAGKIDRVIDVLESGQDEGNPKLSAQTAVILSSICANMSQAIDLYGQLGILIRELVVACNHQVIEMKKPLAESRKISMKMESMVTVSEPVLKLGGIEIPQAVIYDYLRFGMSEATDINEVSWVLDVLEVDPLIGGEERDWSEEVVLAIRLGDRLYPVGNIEMLAAQKASGVTSVQVVSATTESIINYYTNQNHSIAYR
jgi:hypothetical protein